MSIESSQTITPFDAPLNWLDAGTAKLSQPADLQHMLQVWRANLASMAHRAQARGWECTPPKLDAGLSPAQVTAIAITLGAPVPAQLAWAFTQSRELRFSWRASAQDEPRGELSSCYGGGIRDTLWSAETAAQLEGSVMSWVTMHADALREDEQEAQATAMLKFWQQHVAFHSLPNGDMLTLDIRHSDPQQQAVRYFSHEQDGLHGRALAPDFFSFISRWTALGCVGSEWWSWDSFTADCEPDTAYFDLALPFSKRWVAWLDKVPAHLSGQATGPNEAPPMVVAKSAADFKFLLAATANDLDAAKKALLSGANINCTDEQEYSTTNQTAVMHAARHGNLAMLDWLLSQGASLATHVLPLFNVMLNAPVDALKWLVNSGARIDPWTDDRFNALHRLYQRDDLDDDVYFSLLDAMLDAGCNPNVYWDLESSAALTTLLMRGGSVTAQRLLAAGADPLRRDLQGRTAMHYARDAEHVKLLVAHGLDVNDLALPPKAQEADRPLHYSLSCWSVEAPLVSVAALLEQGADPALPDGAGLNAWWHCRHGECALLLEAALPFDAMWRDQRGGTVVHHLIDFSQRIYPHNVALLQYWAAKNLDINVQDASGNTALHAMAQCYNSIHDKPSMVYLLDLGADWNIANLQGKTAKALLKKKHLADWV